MGKRLKKTLITTTILVILLFSIGTILELFGSLSWYDEIVHFLAGAWGGLIVLWLFFKYEDKVPFYNKFKKHPITTIVIAMVIVGIGWEIFELGLVEYVKYTYNQRLGLQPSHFDTFTDLVLDGLGAWLVIYKFKKKSL